MEDQRPIYKDGKKLDGRIIKIWEDTKIALVLVKDPSSSKQEEKFGRLVNTWIEL